MSYCGMYPTDWLSSWWAQSQTVGLVTISLALHAPSQVAAAVKRYANVEGYQVLISMIDENVNHSIQDSINELKSQLVSKVIINVPLEAEGAENRHRQR